MRMLALVVSALWMATDHLFAQETVTFQSGDTSTTLVELFTSEGCSSCPAAEKWLTRFKNNPDLWKKIVPVAFHVDYWDRLGWADRFAKPEFTERQRRYAAVWRGESVYTPGFAVDGKEWRGWFDAAPLPTKDTNVGSLRVTLTNGQVTGIFVPGAATPRPLIFEAALLGTNLESNVKRGENAGRKLYHDFVVLQVGETDMMNEGHQWKGTVSLAAKAGTDKPAALAAWVKADENTGPIQAIGGWLKP